MTTLPPDARPVVVKLGGVAVEDPSRAEPLLRALADLHATDAGGVVIVHGGGRAVDEHLARLGIVSERRGGLRVTSDSEMPEIAAVLAGKVNKALASSLCAIGARAVGMCLGDGSLASASRLVPSRGEPDLGRVGRIVGGDPALLDSLLAGGFLPVIAPIVFDGVGGLLNVNGDEAASGVARVIGARLLVLLTDVPGVLDGSRSLVARLDDDGVEEMIARGVIAGGMIPKVRAALDASRACGAPTLIASWNDADAIRNILSPQARGTLVVARTHTAPPGARS